MRLQQAVASLGLGQRLGDGVEQHLIVDRLGEEIGGATLHRLDAGGDVAAPGEKHHRQIRRTLLQQLLQLQPVQPRHRQIQHQAGDLAVLQAIQALRCRLESLRRMAGRGQQAQQRVAQRRVVVDDVDPAHGMRSSWIGSSARSRAPPP